MNSDVSRTMRRRYRRQGVLQGRQPVLHRLRDCDGVRPGLPADGEHDRGRAVDVGHGRGIGHAVLDAGHVAERTGWPCCWWTTIDENWAMESMRPRVRSVSVRAPCSTGPPGTSRFWACSARETSSTVRL